MDKPKVLLDVDGVLADFVTHYLEALYHFTGAQRRKEEIITWEINASLNLPADTIKAMNRIIKSQGWCGSIPVFDGAREGVEALREIADIHIITSPWNSSHYWLLEREQWLGQYFGFTPAEITQTRDKDQHWGNFLVDDKHSTLVKWAAAHPNERPLLWSTPHNLTDPDDWRLTGWEELLNVVSMWEKTS